jgi:uncharacterized membrane protein
MIITNVLNILVVKQFFAFIFLTFVPGLVLLNLIGFKELEICRLTIFSIGLSLAFIMFVGLAINELYPFLGIKQPLSASILFLTMNLIIAGINVVCYLVNKKLNLTYEFKMTRFLPLIIFLLILSASGILSFSLYKENFPLIIMYLTIPIFFLLSFFDKNTKLISYPLILFVIGFSAVVPHWLVSSNIIGWDIHQEYYVFQLANLRQFWGPAPTPFVDIEILKSNQMLSDTILPLTYAKIMQLDGNWLFKIFYPFLISVIPIALYILYETQVDTKSAFLACFLFISNVVAYGLGSCKQVPGMLFFVLLFIVLFDNKISSDQCSILFIILSAGLVVSHYGTSYIFLLIILLCWVYHFLKRSKKHIFYLKFFLLFFTIAFSWYIYVERQASFDALIQAANNIKDNLLTNFWNLESRGKTVVYGLNPAASVGILHLIARFLFYIIELLIIIGAIGLVLGKIERSFNSLYILIGIVCLTILAFTIILPRFSNFYRAERFWMTAIIFLAPLSIIGGKMFFQFLSRRKMKYLLIIAFIFAAFFLFQSEVLYVIGGEDVWSVPLAANRMPTVRLSSLITTDQEAFGARWLYQNINTSLAIVYSDYYSATHVLSSFGMMGQGYVQFLTNTTSLDFNHFLYFGKLNNINGIFVGPWGEYFGNSSQILTFNNVNKLYSNGEVELYEGR